MREKRRYCINCKQGIDEDAIFCEFCGTRQKKVEDIKIDKEIPEEIREPKKRIVLVLLVLFIIITSCLGISTMILGVMRMNLEKSYNSLMEEYNELNDNYYLLTGEYNELNTDYDDLQANYNTLSTQYQTLQNKYDTVCDYIRNLILPAQYCIFAESVRRYYTPLYLRGKSGKEYWKSSVEYQRDVILHDSEQENSFEIISNAFSECLKYGSDTMGLADYNMYYVFYDWLPNWDGWGLSKIDNLTDINTVHQWCIDEIDYEYDLDITTGQKSFNWDYIKFPVETVFRTMGDCEDQAILDATYLESCGFETAIMISHDPDHPTLGSFYHGSLFVHIEDTDAFYAMYPSGTLWGFTIIDPYEGFTWCCLDPTWDVPFGNIPSWLQDYIDFGGISDDVMSIAICDPDGGISQPELQCSILN